MGSIFCDSSTAPYYHNSLPFHQWLQKEVGKISLCSFPNRSCLSTVTFESQAHALSSLTDLTGKLVPAHTHSSFNTCNRAVSNAAESQPTLPKLPSVDLTSLINFILVESYPTLFPVNVIKFWDFARTTKHCLHCLLPCVCPSWI